MRRLFTGTLFVAAAVAYLVVAAGPVGAKKPKGPRASIKEVGTVTYDFRALKKWPGYYTARMTIRNPEKLRPLFLSGRNREGKITVTFPDESGLEDFGDTSGLEGLTGGTRTVGSATVGLYEITVDRSDLERTAGGELFGDAIERSFFVTIEKITDFQPANDKRGRELKDTFDAKLHGRMTVNRLIRKEGGRRRDYTTKADESMAIAGPCRVAFLDAESTAETSVPARMVIRSHLTLDGSKLGLTHKGSDKLKVYFQCVGYTDFTGEAKKELEDIKLDGPSLDLD